MLANASGLDLGVGISQGGPIHEGRRREVGHHSDARAKVRPMASNGNARLDWRAIRRNGLLALERIL